MQKTKQACVVKAWEWMCGSRKSWLPRRPEKVSVGPENMKYLGSHVQENR